MSSIQYKDIEFVLPSILKAYRHEWAQQLIEEGIIYFTDLQVFHADENAERCDVREGIVHRAMKDGMFIGMYKNPIYVWCGTMETNTDAILNTWRDRTTVVEVNNTLTFLERIRDKAKTKEGVIRFLAGPVVYDKDRGSHRDYFWAQGIFQKDLFFGGQKEFRIALIGDPKKLKDKRDIALTLGDCSDIIRIAKG